MGKCVGCQFYDRNDAHAEDKGVRWGKCRRTGPIVHPMSAKAYMVEGVWPHVRDDDWCGEFAPTTRPVDGVATERPLLMQGAGPAVRPGSIPGSLMTPLSAGGEAPIAKVGGVFGSD